MIPGEYILGEGDIEANAGRHTVELTVANTGDRPIQVGSHFHFFEANRALRFERGKGWGMRLNGRAGAREVHGLNALADGRVDAARRDAAVKKAAQAGFQGA